MSRVRITHPTKKIHTCIDLPTSKSIANRALVIQALSENKSELINLPDADDTLIMQRSLWQKHGRINVKNAGTCMRFLAAYFSSHPSEIILDGDERMRERPIKVLVDALVSLGAGIAYLGKDGFPPLRIKGHQLTGGKVTMDAAVSSQYISALMLVAPSFKQALTIELAGQVSSRPYLEMTAALMKHFGAAVSFENNTIHIANTPYVPASLTIEPDWSAASYWYEIAALSDECELMLNGQTPESIQGDALVAKHMEAFGVETTFTAEGALLRKKDHTGKNNLVFDLTHTPDLAPALATTAAAKNISTEITGLQNLRIKESDRLTALETELNKCGFHVSEKNNTLHITPNNQQPTTNVKPQTTTVQTYNDHRLCMAFAPLALLHEVIIENPESVIKSYPGFWKHLEQAGFILSYKR